MDSPTTILERIQGKFESLTRAERQLANSLLDNYPVSGLSSITAVAHNAGVSTPTVARMVQKLGFKGYPQFQASLRHELEAKYSSPIEKHDHWAESAPVSHILNRFTDAVIQNLRQTLSQIDPEMFDAACAMLADEKRSINVVGGRITQSLADYFCKHMQVVRPRVVHISSNTNIGCDTGQCGACTVHVNGRAIKSCNMFALDAEGATVETIEGMANEDGSLGIIQAAFQEHHGLQCGFCTPGMVMAAADLLAANSDPSETEIRAHLDGNICRCTGYHNIIKSIQAAAAQMG
ncbi:hypothetical protein HGD85_01465 [Rhodobacteraceae bacterium R_SAG10]|nr:hypothetical protein [Rhodobacteraceae bacterium R_SAG10]